MGYELLYWIPFLRGLAERGLLEPERAIAVSRGGVGSWYQGVAARYLDLHELFPQGEPVREAATPEEGVTHKQMAPTPFDREALTLARDRLGLPRATAVLHPSIMYRTFRPAWVERAPPARVLRRVAFAPLPHPTDRPPAGLPERYVAVKAYSSGLLPENGRDGPATAAFRTLIEASAKRLPVVLLRTGLALDDHEDLPLDLREVVDLAGTLPAERNLGIQAAVIAGAELLISNYGGFSYLGAQLGTPTLALYERDRFSLVHHRVVRAMMDRLRPSTGADLTPISVSQVSNLAALLSEGSPTNDLRAS